MWTTTKRCLLRCIATLCVATVFLVRAEDADAPFATQVAKLIADDGAVADYFGYSVAYSDGIAVVGAYNDDDKGSNSGSAYVFEMSDSSDATSWTKVKKLTPDDGAKQDYFGCSVAISDGTIVVGAYADDDKGSGSGSAYVFEKSDSSDATSWTQVEKLTADDGAWAASFGYDRGVAISDGTLVVGAYKDINRRGSAYVFEVKTEYPIKILKTIYANGTITEEVVKSSAAARLGAALMPSSSSDALPLVAAVACVALLAVVATRRARKTSFVNGEEADGLLNANTYGAIYNA